MNIILLISDTFRYDNLFDRAADPYAARNIAAKHPRAVKRLHAKLVAWLGEMDAPPETIALFE